MKWIASPVQHSSWLLWLCRRYFTMMNTCVRMKFEKYLTRVFWQEFRGMTWTCLWVLQLLECQPKSWCGMWCRRVSKDLQFHFHMYPNEWKKTSNSIQYLPTNLITINHKYLLNKYSRQEEINHFLISHNRWSTHGIRRIQRYSRVALCRTRNNILSYLHLGIVDSRGNQYETTNYASK